MLTDEDDGGAASSTSVASGGSGRGAYGRHHSLLACGASSATSPRKEERAARPVPDALVLGRVARGADSGSEVEQNVRTVRQPRDGSVEQWRRKVVKGLQEPWKHQQQQPSWDSVRTVELHEEEHRGIAEERALSACSRWWWAAQGWVLAIVLGGLCFSTYVVIEVGVTGLSSVRFGWCSEKPFKSEEHCPEGKWFSWGTGFLGFCASVGLGTAMAATSAWLVVRFAPTASGSGIPEVKTILNGFVLTDVVTFRTLCIKVPGLVLAVASGMALGHEGPMVHLSVCWAQFVCSRLPQFRNEGKKREMFSAAVAAGISSAFGTPIGGVLFSLEEVSSHFPSRTLLLSFLASVTATLALSVGNVTGTGHTTLFSVRYTVPIHPSEYVMFAILGVAGGLVGAVFNCINIRWNAFRMSPGYKRRVRPIQEVTLVALFTLITSWPLPLTRPLNAEAIHAMFDTCNPQPEETRRSRLQFEFGLCTETGNYTTTQPELLMALGGAAAIRFGQTALTIGMACPAGLFVPSLFIGACMGRCMGGAMKAVNAGHRLFSHSIDPGVYSMVGAAAVLGGICRMTISLVVIMLELTGGLDYVVPFMIAVLLAKAVGDSLNEGIYDLQIVLKGYPFLREELDIAFTERCCDIMQKDLTKLDVGSHPRVADVREMLRLHSFRGFPLVDGVRFAGYIRRTQLEEAIDGLAQVFGESEVVSLEAIQASIDSTVMRMVPDAPLSQAHQVFKQLGCKHIFVVGSLGHGEGMQDALMGMLSKKAFLCFLRDGSVGYLPDLPEKAPVGSDDSHTAAGRHEVAVSPTAGSTGGRLSVLNAAIAASWSHNPHGHGPDEPGKAPLRAMQSVRDEVPPLPSPREKDDDAFLREAAAVEEAPPCRRGISSGSGGGGGSSGSKAAAAPS